MYITSGGLISVVMRPHVDIAWGIHGRVKDFADDHDISLSEAYEQLLTAGLDGEEPQARQ